MTLEEMQAEVLAITRRPDLTAETLAAVKTATLKAHQSDYFYNDLTEIAVEFDQARFIQNFRPRDIYPRYRQVKYMRIWRGGDDGLDPDAVATKFLEHIHIENAIDHYGYDKTDVFYMAGDLLQIRVTVPVRHLLMGAYQHPQITTEGFDSWIAAEYPWAIVYEAARTMFLTMGFQEQSVNMRALVQEQYGTLTLSNVDTVPT